MRKKFRFKKQFKLKKIFILLILFIFFLNFKSFNINKLLSHKSIIDFILKNNIYYSYNGVKNNNIVESIYTYVTNKPFKSPSNLLQENLNLVFKNNEDKNELSFSYNGNDNILVYIYNSHQGEKYSTKYLEIYNIIPDVLMASNMLKDKLENINISAAVEENNLLDYMKKNNLNHSQSYIASRYFLKEAIKKYPKAKLYIDIHRDSAEYKTTYAIINNKPCAKILFVIGLEYDTYEKNLKIVNKLNNILNKKYPGLSRGIMKKSGSGVNGIYNQDLKEKVILIEVGGNENNIEEVNNTLDVLATIIGEYINEEE